MHCLPLKYRIPYVLSHYYKEANSMAEHSSISFLLFVKGVYFILFTLGMIRFSIMSEQRVVGKNTKFVRIFTTYNKTGNQTIKFKERSNITTFVLHPFRFSLQRYNLSKHYTWSMGLYKCWSIGLRKPLQRKRLRRQVYSLAAIWDYEVGRRYDSNLDV